MPLVTFPLTVSVATGAVILSPILGALVSASTITFTAELPPVIAPLTVAFEEATVGYSFSPGILTGALPIVRAKKAITSLCVGCFIIR